MGICKVPNFRFLDFLKGTPEKLKSAKFTSFGFLTFQPEPRKSCFLESSQLSVFQLSDRTPEKVENVKVRNFRFFNFLDGTVKKSES